MAHAHAVVGLPKHGRGSFSELQGLALDGRARNLIARQGTIDDKTHTGSLFWLVGRTSKKADANLVLDPVIMEQSISVTLPNNKKRKHTVSWSSSELPTIPLLVNKRSIEKHTQLLTYVAEDKK